MKVAINSGPLASGHAVRGVGAYTQQLILAMEKIKARYKGLTIEAVDFGKSDLTSFDLVHIPYFNPFFINLPLRKKTKAIVTIHDLIPLIYPKNYPPGIKGYLKLLVQKSLLRKVDGVITVSETSKKDIVRFLGVEPSKIKVIYEAPKSIYLKKQGEKEKMKVKKKYNLPETFVLYVGDVNYNKNILGLIKACRILKVPLVISGMQALEIEEVGLGLDVLTGPKDWFRFLLNKPHPELAHYQETANYFKKNKNHIIRLGFIPDQELAAVYQLASVYCQPSFYEGFGLPVVEAMASGTPIVASKTQALVEIAGQAALFFNPNNPKDMAKKIKCLIKDIDLRTQVIKEGEEQIKNYSWQKTARKTIDYYRELLTASGL